VTFLFKTRVSCTKNLCQLEKPLPADSEGWLWTADVSLRTGYYTFDAGALQVPGQTKTHYRGAKGGPIDVSVLLTSNIVTFLTKFSSGGGVKLLQGYMLRASQGGDDFSSFGGYVIASAAG